MRKGLRWLLFPLGAALLLATVAFQEGIALSGLAAQGQQATATFIPSDRLAEPTQPANPSQADQGARDYWLYCMVCHGDYGQGLTDEFRMLYPPEEQYCWQSGCHGERPYENGFTLPTAIPPVIGSQAPLNKFADASVLHVFITAAMPWHLPGSLEPEVYWRLTAFLLRENGYENPYEELGPENAAFIPLGGAGAALSTEDVALVTPHATAEEAGQNMQQSLTGREGIPVAALAAIAAVIFLAAVFVWSRRKRTS